MHASKWPLNRLTTFTLSVWPSGDECCTCTVRSTRFESRKGSTRQQPYRHRAGMPPVWRAAKPGPRRGAVQRPTLNNQAASKMLGLHQAPGQPRAKLSAQSPRGSRRYINTQFSIASRSNSGSMLSVFPFPLSPSVSQDDTCRRGLACTPIFPRCRNRTSFSIKRACRPRRSPCLRERPPWPRASSYGRDRQP